MTEIKRPLAKRANPIKANDSYKMSHDGQVPGECTLMYSHLTPRFLKYLKQKFPAMSDKVIVYGLQMTVAILQDRWNDNFFNVSWEDVSSDTLLTLNPMLGYTVDDLARFKELHELGYLPLKFKGLPEGSWVNNNIPVLTVCNTHPRFSWLTNFIEPSILNTVFKPMTVATLSLELARLRDKYFNETVSDHSGKDYAIHEFAYRGHSGHESGGASSSAYLLYTKGTDTMAALDYAIDYYHADPGTLAGSIPAFEHSTATLGIQYYRTILKRFFEIDGGTVKTNGDAVLAEVVLKKDKDGKDIPLTDEEVQNIYFEERAKLLHATLTRISLKAVIEGLKAALWVDGQLTYLSEEQRELAIGETFNLARVLIDVYPVGLFAYVSDSYDYNRVISIIVAALKSVITARDGKFVVRPDSADPVIIVNGDKEANPAKAAAIEFLSLPVGISFRFDGKVYVKTGHPPLPEDGSKYLPLFLLEYNDFMKEVEDNGTPVRVIASEAIGTIRTFYEIFGGTKNDKGFIELAPQIGLVYGDGINYDRMNRIYQGMKDNGFAVSNIVLAAGAFMLANLTRDDLGFAIKASYAEVDGIGVPVYKQPKTDMSKASAAGLFKVVKDDKGDYTLLSNVTKEEEEQGELQTIWQDGKFVNVTTFDEIKARLPL